MDRIPAGNGERQPPRPRLGVGGGFADRRRKVLICDDERHVVRLMQVNFERHGYEVMTAYDGREGLEKARAERPDLCIVDVMMPVMDGFEMLKQIRQDPEFETMPVVLITAKAQDMDVFEGYHYGADMYLTKPFNPAELDAFFR